MRPFPLARESDVVQERRAFDGNLAQRFAGLEMKLANHIDVRHPQAVAHDHHALGRVECHALRRST